MKLSKMRQKARSAFKRWTSIWFRWDADGQLHDTKPGPLFTPAGFTEVVVIRGRVFTKPQCAKRKE